MKKLKVLAMLFAITTLTNVYAALQSRPGIPAVLHSGNTTGEKNYTPTVVFRKSREMESEEGVLGLNATFAENPSTGAYEETSKANNIDAHMVKNTEWGAVAMLSSSKYGSGVDGVKDDYNRTTYTYGLTASTTGNSSGVFGMNNGAAYLEYVAGGIINNMREDFSKYLMVADTRYVDNYKDGVSDDGVSRYIPGDATYETKNLKGGGVSFVYGKRSQFVRLRPLSAAAWGTDIGLSARGTRVCIWVGEGI